MSQENVQRVREAYEALRRGGVDAVLPFFSRDVVAEESPEFPDTGTVEGHQGIRRLVANFSENFDDFQVDPQEFVDAGPHVVVRVRLSGRAKGGGPPVDLESFHVLTARPDGLLRQLRVFLDRRAALDAVGLPE
jgi:ketosteroid isomerase-like protein